MHGPSLKPRSQKLGQWVAIMSYFKVADKIRACIASMRRCGFEPGLRTAYVARRHTRLK
jgi:hypothetical protein